MVRRTPQAFAQLLCPLILAACAAGPGEAGEPAKLAPAKDGAPASQAELEPQEEESAMEDLLLGVVNEDGTPVCKDYETRWTDLHFDAGFSHLKGERGRLKGLEGEAVLVVGRANPEAGAMPTPGVHPCAPAQMRSDWVVRPSGTRALPGGRDHAGEFTVTRARKLEELKVSLVGDQLRVEFQNDLGRALEEVQLLVHYEGCYGKPMSAHEESRPVALAAGESTSFRAPRYSTAVRRKGGEPRVHVARSVQLVGKAPHTWFDLDMSLASRGVQLECPEH